MSRPTRRARAGRDRPSFGGAVWRARWLILGAAVVAGIGGYVFSEGQPREYTAVSRVVLSADDVFEPLGGRSFVDSSRFLSNQRLIMTTQPLLRAALERLDGDLSVSELAESVDVSALSDADVLLVAATAPTPESAVDRADAVVTAYLESATERVAGRAAAALAATADPAVADQIRTEAAVYGDGVAVVERAVLPEDPSSPRPLRAAVILAVIAALAATALALLRRPPAGDVTPIAEAAGSPVLGVVPVPGAGRVGGMVPDAEDHALTLVALDYAVHGAEGPVVLTGVTEDSGTAAAVEGLALAAAARGRNVIVLDADPGARALVERLVSQAPPRSVEQLAQASVDTGEGVVAVRTDGDLPGRIGLAMLGDSRDTGFETGGAVDRALLRLTEVADLVLVHTAPVRSSPSSLALVGRAAAVVAVTGLGEDPDLLATARYRIEAAGKELTGVVVTKPAGRRPRHPRRATRSGAVAHPAPETLGDRSRG
ncbi:hypothetical protein [Blastococcus saxobsidens]|uniref:Capsular polysaccharide biosynthesis protein n=1 Tax=Blastococcus saxobsidens (strain DD2) TaxID=1146883 RepID=H6RN30_BLASD|nr:hypothetical protein [Blastococcus saxobsidens]CCG01383.1 protein of unknown function; putative Cell surface polysaccharide biosynthesis domain [Blastococcus saxobsidens DD2]